VHERKTEQRLGIGGIIIAKPGLYSGFMLLRLDQRGGIVSGCANPLIRRNIALRSSTRCAVAGRAVIKLASSKTAKRKGVLERVAYRTSRIARPRNS
jgi:hypothetical protein